MSEPNDKIPFDDNNIHNGSEVPDIIKTSDDNSPVHDMTPEEFQEAIENKSHPHHKEAIQYNKELAKRLRPALNSLKQTMEKTASLSSILKNINLDLPELPPLKPEIPALAKTSAYETLKFEPLETINYKGILENIAEDSRISNERAQRQIEVLESLFATAVETDNKYTKSSRINTCLVILTLVATLAGTIVNIILTIMN